MDVTQTGNGEWEIEKLEIVVSDINTEKPRYEVLLVTPLRI